MSGFIVFVLIISIGQLVYSRGDTKNDPLIVETTTGLIRGLSRTVLDHEVHVYLGIPFAKPPIGPLRFRKPVPIDPWHGILNATTLPNSCIQERYEYFPGFEGEEMWNPNTNISEDCLYLNIYVPQKYRLRHNEGNNGDVKGMPLLVWIYGGGYMSGTATLDVYDADLMAATSNVIIASMQYRVGSFGFLYLNKFFGNSEEAPGNMGLWDQVVALKWLKNNAKVFGGDPNAITIFGESAGGGSVSLHLISPVTKGLVRRGILQSGTLNAPWSFMTGEKATDVARVLVDDCGCNSTLLADNPARVMACMRSVDAKTISVQQWNSYSGILGFPSAPTIDGVFLPKHPLDLLREADYDDTEILIGNNQNEGTYFVLYDFTDYFEKDKPSSLERDKFLGIINTIFKNMSTVEKDAIAFQYTDWEQPKDGYRYQKAIGDAVGDYFFICPSTLFAQLFADRGMKVYYYFFTQRSSTNMWGKWMGVIHGDEVEYVFGHPLNVSLKYTDEERQLSLKMIQVYSNFAFTGKPTTGDEWPPYTRDDPRYFIFNAKTSGLDVGPRLSDCAFWNEFLPRLEGVPESGNLSCQDKQTILDEHNRLRQLVALGHIHGQPGAANMMEMIWDDELALSAQQLANSCAESHDVSRNLRRSAVGQNVARAWTTRPPGPNDSEANWRRQISGWFNEVQHYQTGYTRATSHYTQMVWGETYLVGCGYSFYYDPARGYTKNYVCNYGPSGNSLGYQPYQLGQPSCNSFGMAYSNRYAGLCSRGEYHHLGCSYIY